MHIHLWRYNGKVWWLDCDHAEVQNNAAGPFNNEAEALADADDIAGSLVVVVESHQAPEGVTYG